VTARVQPGGLGIVRRSPTELVVLPTLDSWEARQFPAAAVDRLRPPRSRHVVGVLLGLVLAAAGAATAAAGLVPVVPPGAVRVAGMVLWAVAAFFLYTRGHPVGHVIGGVGGAVGALLAGGPVSGAVALVLVNGAIAAAEWTGYRSRARWWPRLDALHGRHRCVDGTVVEAQRSRRGSSDVHKVFVWITSPDAPGLEWRFEAHSTKEHRPEVGQPVRIWYHPDDPEAAVLCVPGDVVNQDAVLERARRAAAAAPPVAPPDVAVVAVLPALEPEAAFPVHAVERWRPRPAGRGVGIALGVLLGVLGAVVTGPERVDALALGITRAAAVVAAVAVGVLLHRRSGHPAAFGTATVLATALAAAGSGDSRVAMGMTVVLAALTWVVWRERTVRGRTWARLSPLLSEHVRTAGVVERVDVRPHAQDGDALTVRVVAAADAGRGWTVRERVAPGLRPYPGQPVTVWSSPVDPGAAVLGVLDARADPRWTGAPART
jgi:hypothetical protein